MIKGMELQKEPLGKEKRPKRYSGYARYMTRIIEAKPPTFEEVAHQEVWKKDMQEEYQSIMKKDV